MSELVKTTVGAVPVPGTAGGLAEKLTNFPYGNRSRKVIARRYRKGHVLFIFSDESIKPFLFKFQRKTSVSLTLPAPLFFQSPDVFPQGFDCGKKISHDGAVDIVPASGPVNNAPPKTGFKTVQSRHGMGRVFVRGNAEKIIR